MIMYSLVGPGTAVVDLGEGWLKLLALVEVLAEVGFSELELLVGVSEVMDVEVAVVVEVVELARGQQANEVMMKSARKKQKFFMIFNQSRSKWK